MAPARSGAVTSSPAVGFWAEPLPTPLAAPASVQVPAAGEAPGSAQPRVAIAVLPGCPFSARALRLLRTLGIPHLLEQVESQEQRQRLQQLSGRSSLPQLFIDGESIGGYDALVELHGSGQLEALRQG
jgi:glutaredoxin